MGIFFSFICLRVYYVFGGYMFVSAVKRWLFFWGYGWNLDIWIVVFVWVCVIFFIVEELRVVGEERWNFELEDRS